MDWLFSALHNVDQRLSRPIQHLSLSPVIEKIIGFPDGELIFSPKYILIILPILVFGDFVLGNVNLFPAGITVMGFAMAATVSLKLFAFKRRRPEPALLKTPSRSIDVRTIARKAGDIDSFPSGCALMGTTMAYFAFSWTGSPWFLLIIPQCCFVRVYFVCHWLGDTIGGAIVGAGVVRLLIVACGGDLHVIGFTHPLFLASVPVMFLALSKLFSVFLASKQPKRINEVNQ